MSPSSIGSRIASLLTALACFSLVGCKQDLGERCEQGSDCSSGYCDHSVGGMVNAMGKVCTGPTDNTPTSDAATMTDGEADVDDVATPDGAGDASETGDAAGVRDVQADTATSDVHGDTGASDATLEAGSGG